PIPDYTPVILFTPVPLLQSVYTRLPLRLNLCHFSTPLPRSLPLFAYSTLFRSQLVPGLYSTLSQLVPGLCRGLNWCRASTPRSVPGLCSAIGARSLLRNWCQVSTPLWTRYWCQVSADSLLVPGLCRWTGYWGQV